MAVEARGLRTLEQRADLARGRDADRVGENDLGTVEERGQLGHSGRVDPALERAAESDADRHRRRLPRVGQDPLDPLGRFGERRVAVALVELLGRAEGRVDAVEARGREPLVALLVQDEP